MRAPILGQHREQAVEHGGIDLGPLAQLRLNGLERAAPNLDVGGVDGDRLEA
jgi:hypothetical protein